MNRRTDLRVVLILLLIACLALAGIAVYFHSLYRADQRAYEKYRTDAEAELSRLASMTDPDAAELADLRVKYAEAESERKRLEDELTLLRGDSDEAVQMRDALNQQLADYSRQLDEYETQIKELEEQIAAKDAELADMSAKLAASEDDIEHLKELYSENISYDINAQYDTIARLNQLLRNPPSYTILVDSDEPELDENEEPVLDEEGNPVMKKVEKTVWYQISLYYEDLITGHHYSYNADTSWHTASLIKLPFTLSILEAASDYAEQHPEEYAAMMQAYEDYKAGIGETVEKPELPPADDIAEEDAEAEEPQETTAEEDEPKIKLYPGTDYPYDFNKEFAYFASQSWQAGSGKIIEATDGTVYTMAELFQYLLLYSDNVAYYQLKEQYDIALQRDLVARLGLDAMSKSLAQISAHDGGKILRETYNFLTGDRMYSQFMYDAMTASGHRVMIVQGASPLTVAHKYGWDVGTYHDMGIVYDEYPYSLTILTNMDTGSGAINGYIQQIVQCVQTLHSSLHGR